MVFVCFSSLSRSESSPLFVKRVTYFEQVLYHGLGLWADFNAVFSVFHKGLPFQMH